jgi:hypothetical protein
MDRAPGCPYRLFRSGFDGLGRCEPMICHEQSKQDRIDEVEQIDMYGDVIF